ncbi:OLC1v1026869C1 [Oldenlandia corymbosa var. corymbosa]|uniref:OLC1v1026869C1 n=1 Tax=Oldenlandia corymbosa var. corymbosa TaxID=529605 RepID=A0AAV1C8H8_OLDCO|nr:OLC1v1026869C1 [Oldenlandia corymbosa var. corymbosa]
MASSQLKVSMLLLSLAALACAIPSDKGHNLPGKIIKEVDAVVEGLVYCQSCQHYGTWSLTRATPIANATISVLCINYRKIVIFYKAFQTDAKGYFYAELKGFKMVHPLIDHPLHSCHVKIVSSPLESCNVLTNVNYGLHGASLRYENKKLVGSSYEAVVYATGPFAFRPAQCIKNY